MSARFSLNPAVTTSPKDDLAVKQQAQVERFARQQERLPTVCLGQLLRIRFTHLVTSISPLKPAPSQAFHRFTHWQLPGID